MNNRSKARQILEKFQSDLFDAEELAYQSCDLRDKAQEEAIDQALSQLADLIRELKKPCIMKTEYPALGELKADFNGWHEEVGWNLAIDSVINLLKE